MPKKYPTFEERLMVNIAVGNKDECWLWIGKSVAGKGYGNISKQVDGVKKKVYAHREMLLLHKGEAPEGMEQALHSCDNTLCCNPHHLSWGNNSRNRREARDRLNNQGNQKLTLVEVTSIKSDPRIYREIAESYNVHVSTIAGIKQGRSWSPT